MLAFHTRIHAREAGEPLCRFLEKGLAPLGFNTLILELNPGYTYRCFPEFSTGTLCKEDIRRILQCCREYGIRLLPLFQCLSHQSDYGGKPWPLYQKQPHLAWEMPTFCCLDLFSYSLLSASWVSGQSSIEEEWDAYQDQLKVLGLDKYMEVMTNAVFRNQAD